MEPENFPNLQDLIESIKIKVIIRKFRDLAQKYDLNFTKNQLEQIMSMVGGHPYLIRCLFEAIPYQKTNLDENRDLGK